jgi:hypothetical protein
MALATGDEVSEPTGQADTRLSIAAGGSQGEWPSVAPDALAAARTVVALGASCDLVPPERDTAGPRGLSFAVSEFAILEDGRRLTLHSERGWTQWLRRAAHAGASMSAEASEPREPWDHMTRDDIVQTTLNVVLPDDDDDPDDHHYHWLAELLAEQGVNASTDDLRVLPYTVELSPRLEDRFRVE